MLASPEAARFVLVSQAHLFKPTYPKSKENLLGPSALFFHQGDYHLKLRKLIQSSLSPDFVRKLVPDIEKLSLSSLKSWAGGRTINTFLAMKTVGLICFTSVSLIKHLLIITCSYMGFLLLSHCCSLLLKWVYSLYLVIWRIVGDMS